MADIGVDFLGFVFEQRVGGIDQRSDGIDDVVAEHAGKTRDVGDHHHTFLHSIAHTSLFTFITSASPARSLRLSVMASRALMRFARPRARTTPPTSGETTITLS